MDYRELKAFCDEEIKKYPQHKDLYGKEIVFAKRYYDNGINLIELLQEKKPSKKYIIPFLLGITSEIIEEEWEYRFISEESGGGLDIDADFSSAGKEMIQDYLLEKYGEDRVLHVGTFTKLGLASAAKDLLRVYKVDYVRSNEFTKILDRMLSWEDNIENIRENFLEQYKFYQENKSVLDLVPYFVNKIRQGGTHAGGIVISDKPIYKLIPVDRVSGQVCTAFPESAQEQVLDELGVIKFDILGISILDVIRETINMIDEKLFLIIEDDIVKIVSESYINEQKNRNAN